MKFLCLLQQQTREASLLTDMTLIYQVPRKFRFNISWKLANCRPCSRILRNKLVISQIKGLLLFTDHEKYILLFTAIKNRHSRFTENPLSDPHLSIWSINEVQLANILHLYFFSGSTNEVYFKCTFFLKSTYKVYLVYLIWWHKHAMPVRSTYQVTGIHGINWPTLPCLISRFASKINWVN